MRRERKYVILTLSATVIINLIGLFWWQSWNLIIYFSIPILLLLLLYSLLTSQMLNAQNSIIENVKSISPGFEYVTGQKFVQRTLTDAINETQDFIFATGGRAKDVDYLESLTQKVLGGSVRYYRVILGDHIHHPLHTHLQKLIEKKSDSVYVGHLPSEKYGNMLVTDQEVILYLPSPSFGGLDTVLRIRNLDLARKYQLYLMQAYGDSKKIDTETEFRELCRDC